MKILYMLGALGCKGEVTCMHDCARIIMKIMEMREHKIIVNIGTKETISISELVNLICEISGKKPNIIFDKTKPKEGS